jgi:hypothetical protein
MPYKKRTGHFERSRSTAHVPIIQNELVKERLKSFRVFAQQPDPEVHSKLTVDVTTLGEPGEKIKWVMSFDGSPHEVSVREEYPSTRIGYIQVAGVLVHLEELLAQQDAHLVDPTVIHKTSQEALYSLVLPGSNVCRQDMSTVRDSWRAEVYEIFQQYTVEEIPLLDIYMLLVGKSDKKSENGGVIVARCPTSKDCPAKNIEVLPEGVDCPSCGSRIFPTDALRIHEEVSEEHGNATALGRLLTVLEQITMVAYLHFLLNRQARVLGHVGFILDGPLALFGPQAWLHTAMLSFLNGMRASLSEQNLRQPIIIGIEKSGQFEEHASAIADKIPRRHIMPLPDDYIYNHILTFRSSPGGAFGRDTYYGQKFFYKTAQGQMLTITIPKTYSGPEPHDPSHYPVLPDTLALLDRIGTSLYKDAIIPVALAHSYASIPLRTGSKVLTLLSRELLGINEAG